jgi:SAM-dependent methyltransferase
LKTAPERKRKLNFENNMQNIQGYFDRRLNEHGATARGADWNSPESQHTRFEQLVKVIGEKTGFSILDYGCGYGALSGYLRAQGYTFDQFVGYDFLESMIVKAKLEHADTQHHFFTANFSDIPPVDYAVASGVFNIRLNAPYEDWTKYTLECLTQINALTRKGFSANFLTQYSDEERMAERPDLYFANPCAIFDYCKKNFSRNVALLHDYNLYDFTILVRKPS